MGVAKSQPPHAHSPRPTPQPWRGLHDGHVSMTVTTVIDTVADTTEFVTFPDETGTTVSLASELSLGGEPRRFTHHRIRFPDPESGLAHDAIPERWIAEVGLVEHHIGGLCHSPRILSDPGLECLRHMQASECPASTMRRSRGTRIRSRSCLGAPRWRPSTSTTRATASRTSASTWTKPRSLMVGPWT